MRTPRNLVDAKAIYREEKAKFTGSLNALIGSRMLLAVLAVSAIAFASRLMFAPDRLPSVGGLSLAQVGLPPLDFGVAGEQLAQAREAALREGASGYVQTFLAANGDLIPMFNAIGLGLCLALLAWNLTVMTARRRFTRG